MKVLKQYRKDGYILYEIEVCGKCFKDVHLKDIPENKSECRNCRFYRNDYCNTEEIKLRKLDCAKYAYKWQLMYKLFTCLIVIFMVYTLFIHYKLSYIKAIAMLMLACTVLDIICCSCETLFCIIRDKMFCRKLEKIEEKAKKEEEKAKQIEEENAKEELKNCFKMIYYQRIVNAEVLTKMLKKMLDDYNFEESNDKILICYQKLLQTLELIKKDNILYGRLAPIFEVYLPEFYNVLRCYAKFMGANAVTNEYEQIFTNCVDKFSTFLSDQKLEEIFKDVSLEEQFKASIETIEKMLDRGEII